MTYGLRITTTSTDGSSQVRWIRGQTVRMGRNPLNDLHLEFAFVSQFHAVLETTGTEIVLRDLGSTNGTVIDGTRISSDVHTFQGTTARFSVLTLQVEVTVVPLSQVPAPRASKKPLAVTGLLQAPPAELLAALRDGHAQQANPEEDKELRALHAEYRKAWSTLASAVSDATLRRSAQDRGAFLTRLSSEFVGLSQEPDFHRMAAEGGAQSLAMRDPGQEQRIALEGLKELAREFVPGAPPLETPDDLVRFLTRLRETLDVFFKAFLPLRDGHHQFQRELGISRAAAADSAVARADSVTELSSALLDARAKQSEAAREVESTFADMVIHHIAMLNGVMTGVKSLLGEVSPDAVRAIAEQLVSRGVLSRGFGGLGPKQLWKVFEERHAELLTEEKQLFTLLFGRQFSQAYNQAANHSASTPRERAAGERGTMDFGKPGLGKPGE